MSTTYDYKILNYWDDSKDLYVDYIITDKENSKIAHTCTIFNVDDIDRYDMRNDLEDYLVELLKDSKGKEFDFPKVSELSPLLAYIFDFVCESEANMCHIDYNDWEELKHEEEFLEEDINTLKDEINKYNLNSYIILNDGEYKICGFGGLQCCFNDDRERGIGNER